MENFVFIIFYPLYWTINLLAYRLSSGNISELKQIVCNAFTFQVQYKLDAICLKESVFNADK